MKTKDTNIFDNSGCVSRDAMENKLAQTLSSSDNKLFDEHIEHCPLCKEAYEGYLACNITIPTEVEFAQKFENKFPNKRKRIINITMASSVVAAGLILLFLVTPLVKNSFSSSYEEFLSEFNEADKYQFAEFDLDKPIPNSLQTNSISVETAMEIEEETIPAYSPPVIIADNEIKEEVEDVENDDYNYTADVDYNYTADAAAVVVEPNFSNDLAFSWSSQAAFDSTTLIVDNYSATGVNAKSSARMYSAETEEITFQDIEVLNNDYLIGLEYFNKGKYRKAIDQFNSVINYDNYHINALYYKAYSLVKLNEINQAIQIIDFIENSITNISLDMQTRLSLLRKEIDNKQN